MVTKQTNTLALLSHQFPVKEDVLQLVLPDVAVLLEVGPLLGLPKHAAHQGVSEP